MSDMLGIEVVSLEGDVGICRGQQREAETLTEAKLEHALWLERPPRRTAEPSAANAMWLGAVSR